MGFSEASEQRNTHDNCVARLGHPHAQALHDQTQKMFPPSCLQTGVSEVIRAYGVIEVNGVVEVYGLLESIASLGSWVSLGLVGVSAVNGVIGVNGVIRVNASHWRQWGKGGHCGQWRLFVSLESVGLLGSVWVIRVIQVIVVYKAPLG